MKILIGCEESQIICTRFREKGHEAYSCDILPCSGGHPEWHIQQDVLEVLNREWDMMIAHPPCTYLSVMSNCRLKEPGRKGMREKAMEFFMKLVEAPIHKIAIENPRGYPERTYRKPDQIIQPYEFGHPASKATCLWLKNLPKLEATNIVEPYRKWDGKRYRTWVDRVPKNMRSKTFEGIADAIVSQWGRPLR